MIDDRNNMVKLCIAFAIQTFGKTSHIGLTVELSILSSTGSLKIENVKISMSNEQILN